MTRFRCLAARAGSPRSRKIVQTLLSFEQFLGSLKAGIVVMNIHTTKFNDGEISGPVREAR